MYHWLGDYLRAYPIPRAGESATWDEVSGDAFLRALLAAPVQSASFALHHDGLQQVEGPVGVDPRQIAQRIMVRRGAGGQGAGRLGGAGW